jgi:hypothetical protein
MRWDELFADLEGQLETAERAELEAEVADRTRGELARLRLVDRLRPAAGSAVVLTLAGAGIVRGRLLEVGSDWLLMAEDGAGQCGVPLGAVLAVSGLGVRSAMPGSEGALASRLGLSLMLRRVARDRSAVRCLLRDGTTVSGTIDRVGSDFIEIAEHATGEFRRRGAVSAVRTITYGGLAVIRNV